MSNGTERVKAKAAEITGAVKEGVGDLIDNEPLQAEGYAEKIKGQARQEAVKTEERVTGTVEEVEGKVEAAVGGLVGNEKLRVEGKAKALKGRGRRSANRR